MSIIKKSDWLKDGNGNKFAPKTLTSQIETEDGVLLEDKLEEVNNKIPTKLPNPNALTINGQSYDGSATVEVDTTPFIVTVTGNSTDGYIADKTYAETRAVYEAGGTVLCVIDGEFVSGFRIPLGMAIDDTLMFIAAPTTSIFIQVIFTETYVVAVELLLNMTIGNQTWDMTTPVDFTDTINAMIDAKLAEIPNASGVSF